MFPTASMVTTGADALAKRLDEFGPQVARKILRPALRSGVAVLARAQRAAAPKGQIDVKKAIGWGVSKRSTRTRMTAKAGGGVGNAARNAKLTGRKKGRRGGVGISARNIHWYTLGTADRYTGSKSWSIKKGGQKVGTRSKATGGRKMFRGQMRPEHFIREASAAAEGPAEFALRGAIARGIGREWAKQQKKAGSRY
jgi:hypothetical protein